MTSVVCVSQFANGELKIVSIKQEPNTDRDAADQPEPLNLTKPKFPKLDNDELSVGEEKSSVIFETESGECKEEFHDIKQTLKDLIQSRRLAEGKNVLTPVDLVSAPVKLEMSQEEVLRAEERKEQNRKAAHRCRMRRKQQMHILKDEESKLKKRREELETQIQLLNEEKQKLLLTIRSDKCHFKSNGVMPKGGNPDLISLDYESSLDLSDTDTSLNSSQEMPLNLHKNVESAKITKKNMSNTIPKTVKRVFSEDASRKSDCKYCCCPCKCHHSNTSDSDESLSDGSLELDLTVDETDTDIQKVSGNSMLNSNSQYSFQNQDWKKRFSRSYSWESPSVNQNSRTIGKQSQEKKSKDDSSKGDKLHGLIKNSLQAFHFKTIEGKLQQTNTKFHLTNPKDNHTATPETQVPKVSSSEGHDDQKSNKTYRLERKCTDISTADVKSDTDSQYGTDSNESSPNKRKCKSENLIESLKVDEAALDSLNSIYKERKPFFYTDTLN